MIFGENLPIKTVKKCSGFPIKVLKKVILDKIKICKDLFTVKNQVTQPIPIFIMIGEMIADHDCDRADHEIFKL